MMIAIPIDVKWHFTSVKCQTTREEIIRGIRVEGHLTKYLTPQNRPGHQK